MISTSTSVVESACYVGQNDGVSFFAYANPIRSLFSLLSFQQGANAISWLANVNYIL